MAKGRKKRAAKRDAKKKATGGGASKKASKKVSCYIHTCNNLLESNLHSVCISENSYQMCSRLIRNAKKRRNAKEPRAKPLVESDVSLSGINMDTNGLSNCAMRTCCR